MGGFAGLCVWNAMLRSTRHAARTNQSDRTDVNIAR